jgi:hypothetical protein
MTSFIAHL